MIERFNVLFAAVDDFSVASKTKSIYSKQDMNTLFEEALKLPEAERRQFADDLYESLDATQDEFYLSPEQEAELERRIENHRLHPEAGIPWEKVMAEALARK